jgi:hypothetical protein
VDRQNEPFWAPVIARKVKREHLWKWIGTKTAMTACGLTYGPWNVGEPAGKLPRCRQCVKRTML